MASLPVEQWGSILDVLPYEDVRSSFLVSRTFRLEIADHVEVLNILKPAELDVPTARRFRNVVAVNILCLAKPEVDEDSRSVRFEICRDAMSRIVPFLQTFPSLSKVTIGWVHSEHIDGSVFHNYHLFSTSFFRLDEDGGYSTSLFLFREVVRSFCGAFSTRALPPLKSFKMLTTNGNRSLCEREVGGEQPCNICKGICTTFPFDIAFSLGSECYDLWEQAAMIAARPGGLSFLKQSDRLLIFFHYKPYDRFLQRRDISADLLDRMEAAEASFINDVNDNQIGILGISYYTKDTLEQMKRYIETYGCDTSQIHVVDEMTFQSVIMKSNFDFFAHNGFDISEDHFPFIVDDVNEPDLYVLSQGLIAP